MSTFALVYTVHRRAWLGYFTPGECRGLVTSGALTVSHLPIGQVPTVRGPDWTEVNDPNEVAVDVRGSLVTTEGWQVVSGFGQVTGVEMRRVGD